MFEREQRRFGLQLLFQRMHVDHVICKVCHDEISIPSRQLMQADPNFPSLSERMAEAEKLNASEQSTGTRPPETVLV